MPRDSFSLVQFARMGPGVLLGAAVRYERELLTAFAGTTPAVAYSHTLKSCNCRRIQPRTFAS